jgi:hypothetical protein
VTDAFKSDQVPGASAPLGGGLASAVNDDQQGGNPPIVHGGVDNSMGGLY